MLAIINKTLRWGDYPDGPFVVTYINIIKLFSIRVREKLAMKKGSERCNMRASSGIANFRYSCLGYRVMKLKGRPEEEEWFIKGVVCYVTSKKEGTPSRLLLSYGEDRIYI